MKPLKFELIHQSRISGARVGKIHTPHGIIDTPNFVPVGTNAAIKALDTKIINDLDVQLLFCNTYHLLLQPGLDVIKQSGGLHSFMHRTKPLITDSGGFQVFSLAYGSVKDELKSKGQKKYGNSVLRIDEEGVLFRSYRDGALIHLTPETSVAAQKILGADIIIPFDELPPYHIDQNALVHSLDRTHRWQERSLIKHLENINNQAMYAVIHGGIDSTLRTKSFQTLNTLPFDGFAIGGSLGKNREEMLVMLTHLMPAITETKKPIHLLGIGDIPSVHASVQHGIDTFDSSHPTRCARHGLLFAKQGYVKILQTNYKNSFEPIDSTCSCYTCKHYTRAYLHHLFKAHELSAYSLASLHNVHYMTNYMQKLRIAILHDEL